MIPVLFCGMFVNAQITHRFDVTLLRPSANFTVTAGNTYAIGDTVRVILSQGGLTSVDTIGLVTPGGISLYSFTTPRLQGDTVFLAKQDTVTAGTNVGNHNFCVRAFLFDRSVANTGISANFDTTGSRSCVPFTIQGWPTATNDFVLIENNKSLKLSISPNPAIGNKINLDYIAQNASNVDVNIYDMTGRKVFTQSFGKAFKGQEGYGLDISALNNGMYILELRQDGVKATGRFLK